MEKQSGEIIFSVIIPVQNLNDYVKETCQKLDNQTFKNFEVIIFPDDIKDYLQEENALNARIIATGNVSPAVKRDLAVKYARGEYLAFIDDDAYPDENWLEIANENLKGDEISVVGGPQLTPPENNFWQKVSGAMFLSPLSGLAIIRFMSGKKKKFIDDWPTVNFIIKKKDFEKIGGFDSQYWPGEDTKLCLDIIKKLGKKILYVPNLIVYHHRREGFFRHLKQTGAYGLHRGYFAKVFPETSLKISCLYFMPSVFVIFLAVGITGSFFSETILKIFLLGLVLYAVAIFISLLVIWQRTKNLLISLVATFYLMAFHIWYGIRFIQGMIFIRNLKSKLRG